jgi:hypothetical protein
MTREQSYDGDEPAGSARYSDPITESGGWVGRGAVLYDTRDRRPCCDRDDSRCLAHVIGVYEETETGEVYYRVADGTWTTEQWIHGDDLLSLFEPAGWSVTGTKPTYLLTRDHGVEDHHDLMTDGGRELSSSGVDVERLARRGNLTSDNYREAISCRDCRTTWYGHTNPFNATGATVATEYCPYCGGRNTEVNRDLPGAILLNPGVDWPDDDPFVVAPSSE